MSNGEPKHEPVAERSPNLWRTVAEVAQLEGITPRAVQRRCQAGKYTARRTHGEKGEVWEIDASSLVVNVNATVTKDHEGESAPFAHQSPNKNEPRSPSLGREQELREEILFLRGLVEGHQRSEAELRAALREALRAMPKELSVAPNNPQYSAPNALGGNGPAPVPAPAEGLVNGPERPATAAPTKEPRPLWKLILGIR